MEESYIAKVRRILRPLPEDFPPTPEILAHRRKQKRLIRMGVCFVLALACAGGVYNYLASAEQRADREFQAGMVLMKPGSYDMAVIRFSTVISIRSHRAQAYLERGIAYRYLHQPDAALEDFDMALAINPNLSEAHTERGIIFRERGDVKQAMDEFSKGVAGKPTVESYYELAQTYENQGDHQQAIEYYGKAIEEMRNAPYVYRARALARANSGDLEGAAQDRQAAANIEVGQ